jgi:hypothetical protein
MENSPFRWGSASGLLPTRMKSEHPRVAFVCMILPGSQQDPSIFCRWPWFTQGRWEELFSGGNFEWPSTERMLWELVFQFSKQISLEGQLKFNSTLGFVMFCPLFFQLKTLSFHKSLVIRGIDSSWNPTRDSSIASKFSADLSGKLECKRYLQRKLGLKETFGTIGVSSWENLDTGCFFRKKMWWGRGLPTIYIGWHWCFFEKVQLPHLPSSLVKPGGRQRLHLELRRPPYQSERRLAKPRIDGYYIW